MKLCALLFVLAACGIGQEQLPAPQEIRSHPALAGEGVTALALASDGSLIAGGDLGGVYRLEGDDLRKRALVARLAGAVIALDARASRIAAACDQGQILVAVEGQEVQRYAADFDLSSLALLDDRLVVGGKSQELLHFSFVDGMEPTKHRFSGPECVRLRRQANYMRLVARNGEPDFGAIELESLAPPLLVLAPTRCSIGSDYERSHATDQSLRALAMSKDGRSLALAGEGGAIQLLLDGDYGREPIEVLGHAAPVVELEYLRDGRLLSAAEDGCLRLWSPKGVPLAKHRLADGAPLAFVLDEARERIWISQGGEEILSLSIPKAGALLLPEDIDTRAYHGAFDRVRGHYATAGMDGALRVWDVDCQRLVALLEGHHRAVTQVAYDHQGDLYSVGADGELWFWEAEDRKGQRLLRRDAALNAIAVHPKGRLLALGGRDSRVVLFDVTTGRSLQESAVHDDDLKALEFSDDGAWLASAADDSMIWIQRVDGSRLRPQQILEGHRASVHDVAFLPGAKGLVSASLDQTLRYWEPDEAGRWREIWKLEGFPFGINALALDFDGRRVAAASSDGVVRIIDLEKRAIVTTMEAHGLAALAVDFAGDHLFSLGLDGEVWRRHGSGGERTMQLPIPQRRVDAAVLVAEAKLGDLPLEGAVARRWDDGSWMLQLDDGRLFSEGRVGRMLRWPLEGGAPRPLALNSKEAVSLNVEAESGSDEPDRIWLRIEVPSDSSRAVENLWIKPLRPLSPGMSIEGCRMIRRIEPGGSVELELRRNRAVSGEVIFVEQGQSFGSSGVGWK